jgi:hypothetical protein
LPAVLRGARALATRDKYEFQKWALFWQDTSVLKKAKPESTEIQSKLDL